MGTGVGGLITFLVARHESAAGLRVQDSQWAREDRQRRLSEYAELVAAAMKIMGGWADLLTTRPLEEIKLLDAERQAYYEDLHRLMSMTRISAPPDIADAAEAMMQHIKRAQLFVAHSALGGRQAVDGGAENTIWREIEGAFIEARGLLATRIRATLPELQPWDPNGTALP